MKNFFVSIVAGTMLAMPLAASASTIDDFQTQLSHLLAQVVALTADQDVSCVVWTSKSIVKVGEEFTFAWFSTGANSQSAHEGRQWQPFGVQTIAVDKPGTWKYDLTFYDVSGRSTTCSAKIVVSE